MMKNILANLIKHKLSTVLLLCGMLVLSNTVWGTTYYLDFTSYTDDGYSVVYPDNDTYVKNSDNNNLALTEICTGVFSFEYSNTRLNRIQLKLSKSGSNSFPHKNDYDVNSSNPTIETSGTNTEEFTLSNVSSYSCGSSGYTVTSSVSNNGDIDPDGDNSVSSTQIYNVSLDDGYKVSSVTNNTGGTLDPTAAEMVGLYGNFSFTLSSPTGNGAITVNTTLRTTYSLSAPEYNGTTGSKISPSGSETVYEGDAITYTVTPTSGHIYKSCNFSGTKSGEIVRSDNTFTFYPTSVGKFSVTYGPASGSGAPTVRIGEKVAVVAGGAVDVSAYVHYPDCDMPVNEITVYYSNNSGFRNQDDLIAKERTFSFGSSEYPGNNDVTTLQLLAAQVVGVVSKGQTLYLRLKARNTDGTYSDYSDVVSLIYNYSSIVPRNISESVTACNGSHRFKWTGEDGMFNPAPDPNGWSAKYNNASGADVPEGEFTLDGEYMIWDVSNYDDNDDDTPHLYTFYFTATKEGYTGANATLNMSLSAEKSDATVVIKQSGTEVTTISANPWHEVALTATRSDSGTGIEWTYPSTLIVDISNNGGNAKIKGTETTSSSLEVTARAVTATCGRSEPATLWVDINKIEEPCTQP